MKCGFTEDGACPICYPEWGDNTELQDTEYIYGEDNFNLGYLTVWFVVEELEDVVSITFDNISEAQGLATIAEIDGEESVSYVVESGNLAGAYGIDLSRAIAAQWEAYEQ